MMNGELVRQATSDKSGSFLYQVATDAKLSDAQAGEIKAQIAEKGLDISGLGFYPNPLHPDPKARAAAIDHLKSVIVATGKMGLPVTNTFCGGDASKTVDQNWEEALNVWPDIVSFAQDNDDTIAWRLKVCQRNEIKLGNCLGSSTNC